MRYETLLERRRRPPDPDAPRHGPLSLRLLSRFQERVAESYKVQVGEEMLAAAEAARDLGARIALIDMDARIAFQRFLRSMGLWERIKFFGLLLGAAIGVDLGSSTVEDELKRFDEDSAGYLEAFGKEFPAAKRVLIDERNSYMAGRIKRVCEDHARVVAVIGDGHVDGIVRELKGWDPEVVRLRQLRESSSVTMRDRETTYTMTFGR